MPRKPYNEKPRPDAWDAALTDAQRWQAYDKFVQYRAAWWEVASWVEKEFGIKQPSRSGLYRFADRMKPLENAYRVRQSIEARAFAGELAKKAGQTDEDLIAAYETLAADAALQLRDADKAAMYTKMAIAIGAKIATRKALEIKGRAQDTKEEALKLQREKFEYDAAKAAMVHADKIKSIVADPGLTKDDQILAVRRELFGEVPE